MIEFELNGKPVSVEVEKTMPLLWVLRDVLQLTGTKFGCGVAQCGACSVQVDGKAVRTCVLPVGQISGKRVTTVEGLTDNLGMRLKKAWLEVDVPQCGYCQSGQLVVAHAALQQNPHPKLEQIIEAMKGNLCRCGTYQRIQQAMLMVSQEASS